MTEKNNSLYTDDTTANITVTGTLASYGHELSTTYSNVIYAGGGSGGASYTIGPTTTLSSGFGNVSWHNLTNNSAGVQINTDTNIDGTLKVKGKDILELFEKIEERLAILHPNPKLEEKWQELKELSKRYKELEADIIEKEKIWNILQK